MTDWIIVASRAEAKIFAYEDSSLTWLQTIANPEGRSHERDFFTDRPSLNFPRMKSMRGGAYGLGAQDPHKQVIRDRFAREIAKFLHQSFAQQLFNNLTIFAEPHLLGIIRLNLSKSVLRARPTFISKDLGHATKNELEMSLRASS